MSTAVFFKTIQNCDTTTTIQPITYKKQWVNENFEEPKSLIKLKHFFEDKIINIISSEFLIHNTGVQKLLLVIKDNEIEIMNIKLKQNETQKYFLGISDSLEIIVQGNFDASLYISTY